MMMFVSWCAHTNALSHRPLQTCRTSDWFVTKQRCFNHGHELGTTIAWWPRGPSTDLGCSVGRTKGGGQGAFQWNEVPVYSGLIWGHNFRAFTVSNATHVGGTPSVGKRARRAASSALNCASSVPCCANWLSCCAKAARSSSTLAS